MSGGGRIALLMLLCLTACSPDPPPIASGRYAFKHKFAEQPNAGSMPLVGIVDGTHISLINESESTIFPKGVIAEGTLFWHAPSGQWIIGQNASDADVVDVGGCSDGPEVVDLKNFIYWTC